MDDRKTFAVSVFVTLIVFSILLFLGNLNNSYSGYNSGGTGGGSGSGNASYPITLNDGTQTAGLLDAGSRLSPVSIGTGTVGNLDLASRVTGLLPIVNLVAIPSGSITSALGYTPLANTSGSITNTLGFTPASYPITLSDGTQTAGLLPNTKYGTPTSGQVTEALGFTPNNGTPTTISTAEVQGGTTTTIRSFTALRIAEAIDKLATIATQDEGATQTANCIAFNFVGAGVTATNVGSTTTVTIPGGGSSGVGATATSFAVGTETVNPDNRNLTVFGSSTTYQESEFLSDATTTVRIVGDRDGNVGSNGNTQLIFEQDRLSGSTMVVIGMRDSDNNFMVARSDSLGSGTFWIVDPSTGRMAFGTTTIDNDLASFNGTISVNAIGTGTEVYNPTMYGTWTNRGNITGGTLTSCNLNNVTIIGSGFQYTGTSSDVYGGTHSATVTSGDYIVDLSRTGSMSVTVGSQTVVHINRLPQLIMKQIDMSGSITDLGFAFSTSLVGTGNTLITGSGNIFIGTISAGLIGPNDTLRMKAMVMFSQNSSARTFGVYIGSSTTSMAQLSGTVTVGATSVTNDSFKYDLSLTNCNSRTLQIIEPFGQIGGGAQDAEFETIDFTGTQCVRLYVNGGNGTETFNLMSLFMWLERCEYGTLTGNLQ